MGDVAPLSPAARRRGISALARAFGFRAETLRGRGHVGAHGSRRLALARAIAAWWLRQHHSSTADVARELGLSTPGTRSAIRRAVARYGLEDRLRYQQIAEEGAGADGR